MPRKITQDAVRAFMSDTNWRRDNTEVRTSGDSTRMYLHGNCIARRFPQTGDIHVSDGGWQSATTKERLNGIPGVRVHQRDHQWHLNDKPWSGSWTDISTHHEDTMPAPEPTIAVVDLIRHHACSMVRRQGDLIAHGVGETLIDAGVPRSTWWTMRRESSPSDYSTSTEDILWCLVNAPKLFDPDGTLAEVLATHNMTHAPHLFGPLDTMLRGSWVDHTAAVNAVLAHLNLPLRS